jgi:hypothetical protein
MRYAASVPRRQLSRQSIECQKFPFYLDVLTALQMMAAVALSASHMGYGTLRCSSRHFPANSRRLALVTHAVALHHQLPLLFTSRCPRRLEPQLMIIGQSAGVAAAMALRNGKQVRTHEHSRRLGLPAEALRVAARAHACVAVAQAVQDVDVAALQRRLRELGQIIDLTEE